MTISFEIPAGFDATELLITLRENGFSLFYKTSYLGRLTPIAYGAENVIQLNRPITAIKNEDDRNTPPFELLSEVNKKYPRLGISFDKPIS